MELNGKAEEALESLWILTEGDGKTGILKSDLPEIDDKIIEQLLETNVVSLSRGVLTLTPDGRTIARNVLRRHLLTERLFADVLNTGDSSMQESACKFDHIIDRGLEDSICTLLGHPKFCPHGKPIPQGTCCLQHQKLGQRAVSSLSQLTPGQAGKVAYIHIDQPERLQKLTALGILPGTPVKLMQDFPSYVLQAGRSQFAFDSEIAENVYVRLSEPVPAENIKKGLKWLSRRASSK